MLRCLWLCELSFHHPSSIPGLNQQLVHTANRQDHHTISGGWGPFATKFVVTGHEVIGKVVEVGKAVKEFKVGQRVGVGAQVGSCGDCGACKNNLGMLSLLCRDIPSLAMSALSNGRDFCRAPGDLAMV